MEFDMAFPATKRLRTATRYADDGTADVLLCDEELVADVALVGAIGNLYHVVVMRRSMCHVRMCESLKPLGLPTHSLSL